MDVNSQIVAKRAVAVRLRQSASRLSGDHMIQVLVFAAQLEIQADILEDQQLVLDGPITPLQWPESIKSFH